MTATYPLHAEVDNVARVARWRPFFNLFLAAPSLVWVNILGFGAIAVAVASWFAIVFRGRLPENWGNYQMGVLRYRWRTMTYLYGLTDRHPGFNVVPGYADPGQHPAMVYAVPPDTRRRATVVFRAILVLPQGLVLYLLDLAAYPVLIVGWFSAVILGRWPRPLLRFVVGWLGWSIRVGGYTYLVVDDYPPFRFRVDPVPGPVDRLPAPAEQSAAVLPGSALVGLFGPDPDAAAVPDAYTPPRLIRWPIVVGCILFVGWIAQFALARPVSNGGGTRSGAPYVLTDEQGGFSATFPWKPERVAKTVGSTTVLIYLSSDSDEAVGITSLPLTNGEDFSLDDAVDGAAEAEPDGRVVSRGSAIFEGQRAEDAVIAVDGGSGDIRVVVIGSNAYILEGFGSSVSAFSSDYQELLDTFTPTATSTATGASLTTP